VAAALHVPQAGANPLLHRLCEPEIGDVKLAHLHDPVCGFLNPLRARSTIGNASVLCPLRLALPRHGVGVEAIPMLVQRCNRDRRDIARISGYATGIAERFNSLLTLAAFELAEPWVEQHARTRRTGC
jgi:hypothetical protein